MIGQLFLILFLDLWDATRMQMPSINKKGIFPGIPLNQVGRFRRRQPPQSDLTSGSAVLTGCDRPNHGFFQNRMDRQVSPPSILRTSLTSSSIIS